MILITIVVGIVSFVVGAAISAGCAYTAGKQDGWLECAECVRQDKKFKQGCEELMKCPETT